MVGRSWLCLRSSPLSVCCWDGTNVFNEHHDIMHSRKDRTSVLESILVAMGGADRKLRSELMEKKPSSEGSGYIDNSVVQLIS